MHARFSLLPADLNVVLGSAAGALTQAQELRRPKHIGSLSLDYATMGGALRLSAGADFHGAQKDTDFGTFQTVSLSGYTLLRAAAAYRVMENLELTARVENALDQDYEEVVGYRTRGLGVFAGLRAHVGQ